MADNEASALKAPTDPQPFCERMDQWADTAIVQRGDLTPNFEQAWQTVRLAIRKSCLLDRLFYGGERPSQTLCPVHKGKWTGCHFAWPGRMGSDGKPVEVPAMLQGWYDAGCRCAYHRCGCTTGWQPDEHCGCGGEETLKKAMGERYQRRVSQPC